MGVPIDSSLETWLEASVEHVQRVKRAKRLGKERSVSNIIKHEEPTELASWHAMREQADALVKSGFLPKAVNTPEKAMAIIQTGRELGLGPMQSLRSIHIIDGKPTMGADLIGGLALAKVPGSVLRVAESTNTKCVVQACRSGQEPTTFTFTIEDAKNAGLTGKQNWRNYPRAMLRARAITEAARAIFPDAVMGLYDPDELGAVTTPEGAVVELPKVVDLTERRQEESPRISGHGSPDASPKWVDPVVYRRAIQMLTECDKAVFDPACSWETMNFWRQQLGRKGAPSVKGQELSEIYRGDISNEERAELSKLWNRVDRKLTQLEGRLKGPSVESSFIDEPDGTEALAPEREPGDDTEEL